MRGLDARVICFIMGVLVSNTLAVKTCENIIGIVDLQDLIRNQKNVMEEQRKVIQDQNSMIEQLKTGKRII